VRNLTGEKQNTNRKNERCAQNRNAAELSTHALVSLSDMAWRQ
jgi:hypothetical protein